MIPSSNDPDGAAVHVDAAAAGRVGTPESTDAAVTIVPRIRLFTERLVVDRGAQFEELDAAVLQLSFEYPGATVRSSDPQQRVFCSHGGRLVTMARDCAEEARARCTLEGFGAVDLECLEDFGVPPDSAADYLVRVDGDVHSHCAFTAYAVPQLRSLGWKVKIDEDYPYQVVEQQAPWYAAVEPEQERPDWFGLELGVEIDGRRINLLPIMLDLLDSSEGQRSIGQLARNATRLFALPVGESHYLPIPPDRLRALLRVVVELYQGGQRSGDTLTFPHAQAAVLAQLDGAFARDRKPLQWNGATEVVRWGHALSDPPPTSPEPPPELRATLRPYQQEGLQWLQHVRSCGVGGILADDMGLGKTLQTIAHLVLEKASGRARDPSLVVAPTSLVGNWNREIRRFAPHLDVVVLHGPKRHAQWARVGDADVVVTSYPLLVRDEERLVEQHFHLLILDEAHTIKNTRSLAHRAAKGLDADYRLCLTGTPVENHLGELWALFDFLNPGLLGDEQSFQHGYRRPIERHDDEERLSALQQQVAPYILRRCKEQVATELPSKTELTRPVELAGKQRDLYESIRVAAHGRVRRAIRNKGLDASTITILDALMKLRQLCCDPRLLRMDAARFVRESAKYDALFELLDKQLAQGRRALVFSQFTSMLGLISKGLASRRIPHLGLTGATQNRQRVVDDFENGRADVFLISLKAGGTGLNLTSADTVIHYDPWWNPAAQEQATDRAYRIGQTKPVFVYNLFVAGSVEERMLQLQRRKRSLASAILGSDTRSTGWTAEDVEVLFAPLTDGSD